jgi:hypothetical protein
MTSTQLAWVHDLRATMPPVMDQGHRRPTCLSCASSTVHTYLRGSARSVEHLHYLSRRQPGGAGSLRSVRDVLGLQGHAADADWPYDPSVDEDACSPIPPGPMGSSLPRADLVAIPAPPIAEVPLLLSNGASPLAIIRTTPEFHKLRDDVLSAPGKPLGLHAVVVVGAATVTSSTDPCLGNGDVVLLLQNSWGFGWGDRGYGLIGPSAWKSMVRAIVSISPTP